MLVKSTHLTGRARLSAKKSDRKGGMLLLVVIIMAVALILITSALTITTAARNRYYNSALTDQATITATSVAKTIGAAVEKGDITLTEIETLAGANGGAGTVIPVTSATAATKTAGSAGTDKTKAAAPGLYNDTSRSYTSVLVKYFTNSAGKKLIQIQATTGLDVNGAASTKTQTESVYLEKITPAPPGGAFSSLVMCGVPGSTNNFYNVTVGGHPADQTMASNYIVLNGNMGISASGGGSQTIISDVIFTGQMTPGAGNTYTGNVVFYGNKASIMVEKDPKDKTGGSGVITAGMMIFIGDDITKGTGRMNVYTNKAGAPMSIVDSFGGLGGALGVYFYNAYLDYSASDGMMNSTVKSELKLPPAGVYADTNALLEYKTNNMNPNTGLVYMSWGANALSYYYPAATKVYLADRGGVYAPNGNESAAWVTAIKAEAEKIKTANMISSITRTLPNPLTTPTFYTEYGIPYQTEADVKAKTTPLTSANLTGASGTYTNAAYYIDAAATQYVGNDCTDGKCSYGTPSELVFDLKNNDITVYILGKGNTLYFGSGCFRFINGGTHTGRIVLMDGVKINISASYCSFDTGIIGTDHIADGTHTKVNYVKPIPKPYLYIYGINNNSIYVDQYAFLEGYIGMYGTGGTMNFNNGPYFYGRLEASIVNNIAGSQMVINYCPSPTEDSSGGGSVSSYYQINGYQAA